MIKLINSTKWTVNVLKVDDDLFIGNVREIQPCHAQATTLPELLDRMEISIKFMCDTQSKVAEYFGSVDVSKENFNVRIQDA